MLNKFTSNTTIQATEPAGELGYVDAKLVNPDGQEAVLSQGYKYANPDNKDIVLPAGFTYVEPALVPAICAINLNTGLIAGNEIVTLTGSNFVSGAVVYFNDVAAKTTFVNNKQLRFTTPAWSGPAVDSVMVENPDGQRSVESVEFSYIEPQLEPVSITLLDPICCEPSKTS